MKLRYLMILAACAASAVACAADAPDRSSPMDSNAACMDRTVDASTGNCVVKDEGTPRHTYPPKPPVPVAAPTPAPAPASASALMRKSAKSAISK
jgi:hypothetical protein